MELTLEEALKGKATRIKNKDYFETKAYLEPFIERMSKFTDDLESMQYFLIRLLRLRLVKLIWMILHLIECGFKQYCLESLRSITIKKWSEWYMDWM